MIKYRINRDRVEERMKHMKINQVELAEKLGVTKQSVHTMLTNGSKKVAARLAQVLKCKANDLIEVKND